MKRMVYANDSAHQMYENRRQALAAASSEDYQSLQRMMSDEVAEWTAAGNSWEDYAPSPELRKIAKEYGCPIRKVRAEGAFPYAIELPH